MDLLLYFIITFLVTFSLSFITIIKKCLRKDGKTFKKSKKLPVEVDYLVRIYNIDLNKINYVRFIYLISIVASIDMAVTVVVISPIKNIYLQILVGFFVIIPLILVTYNSIGNYYIKKGMIKNGNKNRRK